MCKLCDAGQPQAHDQPDTEAAHRWNSRRGFLKASGAAGAAGADPAPSDGRASRSAFSTTTSELADMPSPASHGGISPASASGMATTL